MTDDVEMPDIDHASTPTPGGTPNPVPGAATTESSTTPLASSTSTSTSAAGASAGVAGGPTATVPPRIEPNITPKDVPLVEFLSQLDNYAPIIPDAVADYYLSKSGLSTADPRVKRLLALATQKFVADIASDAYQYSRIRSASSVSTAANPQARAKALLDPGAAGGAGSNTGQTGGVQATGTGVGASSAAGQGKLVLTMENLGSAVAEYGLNIKKPDFYR